MGGLRTALDGSGNAKSKAESTAEGSNTHGVLNRHPAAGHNQPETSTAKSGTSHVDSTAKNKHLWPFKVGVAEDQNRRWRRTMEDAHAFVYDYGGVHGQGFFAVFDGHAGKQSAEWCGKNFHNYLVEALTKTSEDGKSTPVPDVLNTTFHNVDARLYELSNEEKTSSGCTAVACFLRLEDQDGVPVAFSSTGGVNALNARRSSEGGRTVIIQEEESSSKSGSLTLAPSSSDGAEGTSPSKGLSTSGSGRLFSSIARRMRKSSVGAEGAEEDAGDQGAKAAKDVSKQLDGRGESSAAAASDASVQIPGQQARRVLYTANVGDARAVLCRRGQAVRLTYDHKASDAQEAKRITDAGGFVMNNRVNAVLAVTRSLGDSAMKEFVVGAPYTTETTLTDDDTFLIVACDGLWDVVDDQDAVNLVANIQDPVEMSKRLLQHALSNFSTDNTSVMVVRFRVDASGFPSSQGAAAAAASQPSSSSSALSSSDRGTEITSESSNSAGVEASSSSSSSSSSSDAQQSGHASSSIRESRQPQARIDAKTAKDAAAGVGGGGGGGSIRSGRDSEGNGEMTGYATTDSPETESFRGASES